MLILDAEALIAFERGDRAVQAILVTAAAAGDEVKTSAAVVAQVWREPARQVALARLLLGVDEVALTPARARAIGALLRATRTSEVVDASLVELARDGDEILTDDPDDLLRLAEHSGKTIIITPLSAPARRRSR